MKYLNSDLVVKVGDEVIADGVLGTVVCDYDSELCSLGYESWLTQKASDGTNFLSSGIMVETKEYGFLYYPIADSDLILHSRKTD